MQPINDSALRTKPKAVQFTLLTSEDIRKLAVCRIISPISFDLLGHPLNDGLYDKRLGPVSDKGEPCQTCQCQYFHCPGHFGYIGLPLPVVHPLFHKVVCQLLKYSCLHCSHIQISGSVKHVLDVQAKLLDRGLLVEAEELAEMIRELLGRHETLNELPESEAATVKTYEALIEQMPLDDCQDTVKNIEDLRNKTQYEVWKGIKGGRSCLYCKVHPSKITAIRRKLFICERQTIEDVVGKQMVKAAITKPITPEQSREYIRKIWAADAPTLKTLFPVLAGIKGEHPTDVFFMDIIAVPPCNVRPLNVVNGHVTEHTQTAIYKRILQDALLLRAVMRAMRDGEASVELLPAEARAAYAATRGTTPAEKFNFAWDQLQADVDLIVDNEGKMSGEQGLKQIIEKKAGIIRQHMMGKRVNFAARSVITPDPNLSINEIGIPEVFAKNLTYPVPVTSWNVEEMRKLITNGPTKHPGAVMVEFEDGRKMKVPKDEASQASILKRLLTPDGPESRFIGLKIVHRHLNNGDVLLLNRQPTLHRPSIMAHTARVLKDEKTLRLHYANCKAYNADFDGDEMNAHFPQNEVARAEGYHIANVANQYLSPKDGAPLSGLIQDHMIAGVKMSLRGRFFDKMDYQQLCFQALSTKLGNIDTLPPAILKPKCLWSGKQVLSTVILNVIPRGRAAINLVASAKIPPKAWQNGEAREWKCGTPFKDPKTMSEAEVVIRNGELLVGILDKMHYGATPYGLVHCMYELYGGSCAIKLLSAFAKLFTSFLQTEGFTLGVEDILVRPEADVQRTQHIKRSRLIGTDTMRKALNVSGEYTDMELVAELERQAAENPKLRATVDRAYKSALDSYTNDVNKACLPAGLVARFPANNLQLMVQSGAKGSTVNTMQISCMLGQIELEGKRPPVMISGRSLPSFPAHDFSPRAGGYIDGRFMTGIQPQEFFFHCMAGREGLIDTAVKTSRSGYLQRCLIKHLEGLRVGYDMTVRDSDQSVIQFCYGEDGMDISKAQFLNKSQLAFLAENVKTIADDEALKKMKESAVREIGDSDSDEAKMAALKRDIDEWIEQNGSRDLLATNLSPFTLFSAAVKHKVAKSLPDPLKVNSKTGRTNLTKFIVDLWQQVGDKVRNQYKAVKRHAPPPVASCFQPDSHFGSLNERLQELVNGINCTEEGTDIRDALRLKAMQSFAAPGDPVGLLAAQSIGEPSTQMTLNTFHFAGRGEMNVTLGIPRLREILMMASKLPKTPSMEVPFIMDAHDLDSRAEHLLRVLTRVTVADILEKIVVTHELVHQPGRQYRYVLRFDFLPRRLYRHKFNVTPRRCLKYMQSHFFKLMFMEIRKRSKMRNDMANLSEVTKAKAKKPGEDDEEEGAEDQPERDADDLGDLSSEDEPEDLEDAKTMAKYQQAHDAQEDDSGAEDVETTARLPEDMQDNPTDDSKMTEDAAAEAVRSHTVHTYNLAENYVFDTANHEWCELTFNLPLGQKQFDLTAMLREVASRAVLWETPGVRRAIAYNDGGRRMLRTDGVNFGALSRHADLLDLNKLYSNDVHRVAQTYGVEAAARVVVREVKDVFKVYGIGVDLRHLSLIADYMTFSGTFEPLNRTGMQSSASPLQQMSFESSLTFLRAAVLGGKRDALGNPSGCLMVGKPCAMGTGAFGLLHDLKVYESAHA